MRAWVLVPLVFVGCAGKARPQVEPKGPDLTGVVRISSRFGMAHLCPLSPTRGVTSAHVVDQRPFDLSVPTIPFEWSVGDIRGTGYSTGVQAHRDIAYVVPSDGQEFPVWFPLAKARPLPGDTVYLLGYDWRTQANVMADRRFRVKVLRIVAGIISINQATDPGSSGSCVLNEAGEVVGVLAAGMYTQDLRPSGLAVAFWEGLENERPRIRKVPDYAPAGN